MVKEGIHLNKLTLFHVVPFVLNLGNKYINAVFTYACCASFRALSSFIHLRWAPKPVKQCEYRSLFKREVTIKGNITRLIASHASKFKTFDDAPVIKP